MFRFDTESSKRFPKWFHINVLITGQYCTFSAVSTFVVLEVGSVCSSGRVSESTVATFEIFEFAKKSASFIDFLFLLILFNQLYFLLLLSLNFSIMIIFAFANSKALV